MNHVDVSTIELKKGGHGSPDEGVCVMEAVALFAGEPHSAHPACASHVLTEFAMSFNDGLDDAGRQRLVPYIPRLAGSKASDAVELRRSWMAFDWLIRVHAPAFLRLAGLTEHADRLEQADPIVDHASLDAIREGVYAAQKAATAAWDAAGAAAWDAARAAARAAAGDAAWDAAWDAARAAAGDALQPTVSQLQDSAFELLDRMLAVTEEAAAA